MCFVHNLKKSKRYVLTVSGFLFLDVFYTTHNIQKKITCTDYIINACREHYVREEIVNADTKYTWLGGYRK